MTELTLQEAVKAAGGKLFNADGIEGGQKALVGSITLDSRRVGKNALFVAIKGERVDGHDYIASAMERGALAAISEKDVPYPHIRVKSSLAAMQGIAAYMRNKSGLPVIAVVGSVGKTTTRQMLTCVLEQKYSHILSTDGNFNNEFGLPQMLFKLEEYHELAVLELGISTFGEMTRLGKIARPNYAVYTNIGNMHLENLGDRDGVLKAKTELVPYIKEGGKLFLNGADDKLRAYDPPVPVCYFGVEECYCVHAEAVEQIGLERTDFTLVYRDKTLRVSMPAAGAHMVLNAIAAATVAAELGLTAEQVKAGIENYSPVGHRGRVEKLAEITLVDDCYNAGPDSMRASISTLKGARRVALLGDMLELGKDEQQLHISLGEYCAKHLDALFTVGTLGAKIAEGAEKAGMSDVFRTTHETAADDLKAYLKAGDVLLIKASRGMHLEDVVEAVMKWK
ncbi:MAG: UDP-N-acetylmuramoyl-tripeptide--D-alanyl-D-alanine ligase [Clostridia bacterium]|nr:UDP-N-acetylmuramoyl-tripeptide--D-alanyl-D-alanine ligase [Clostridia bacterium]